MSFSPALWRCGPSFACSHTCTFHKRATYGYDTPGEGCDALAVAHPWASASSYLSSQSLADSRCNLHATPRSSRSRRSLPCRFFLCRVALLCLVLRRRAAACRSLVLAARRSSALLAAYFGPSSLSSSPIVNILQMVSMHRNTQLQVGGTLLSTLLRLLPRLVVHLSAHSTCRLRLLLPVEVSGPGVGAALSGCVSHKGEVLRREVLTRGPLGLLL